MARLVSKGKPLFCVQVYPPQDAEAMRDALAELVVHLEGCLAEPSVPAHGRAA